MVSFPCNTFFVTSPSVVHANGMWKDLGHLLSCVLNLFGKHIGVFAPAAAEVRKVT